MNWPLRFQSLIVRSGLPHGVQKLMQGQVLLPSVNAIAGIGKRLLVPLVNGLPSRCVVSEEFSKLVNESIGLDFKALRYKAYDVLAELELRLLRDQSLHAARVYLLVDCSQPIGDFSKRFASSQTQARICFSCVIRRVTAAS